VEEEVEGLRSVLIPQGSFPGTKRLERETDEKREDEDEECTVDEGRLKESELPLARFLKTEERGGGRL
jgi:hypothetical protein